MFRFLESKRQVPEETIPASPYSIDLSKPLGQGGAGIVYLCTNKSGEVFAAKTARTNFSDKGGKVGPEEIKKKKEFARRSIALEIALIPLRETLPIELLSSIVLPLDSFLDADQKLWAIYPLVESREYISAANVWEFPPISLAELHQRVRNLQEIAKTIDGCAAHNLFHFDLKPNAIFFPKSGNSEPLIMDFGISVHFSGEEPKEHFIAMTYKYSSPERIAQSLRVGVSLPDAFHKSEIFSFATLVYEALAGYGLYNDKRDQREKNSPSDKEVVSARVRNGGMDRYRQDKLGWIFAQLDVSEEQTNMVLAALEKALSVDPKKRYTTASEFMDDIVRALPLNS